jgi:hypothetical protein
MSGGPSMGGQVLDGRLRRVEMGQRIRPVNRVLNVLRVPVGIRHTAVSNHDAPPTFKTLKTFVWSSLSSRTGRWTCQYRLFAVVGWTPDTTWY